MDDISQQLDKTTSNIFQVLEDLYQKQDELQQVMSEGYLGISRTRYTLGMKRISADQIVDADLTANYTTKVHDSLVSDFLSSSEESNQLNSDNGDVKLFELCEDFADLIVSQTDKDESQVKDSAASPESKESEGLRKRNIPSSKTNEEDKQSKTEGKEDSEEKSSPADADQDDDNSEEKSGSKIRRKPISLFGVLVPQSLQSSQKCFEVAVGLAVSIADLMCRLDILHKEYKRQRSIKDKLLLEEEASSSL